MTCQDCIHNEVCDLKRNHYWLGQPIEKIDCAEIGCSHFKPMCKDCIYSRPIDHTKSPEKYFKEDCVVCEYEDVVGDEPMIYLPKHYCSHSKHKEDGNVK